MKAFHLILINAATVRANFASMFGTNAPSLYYTAIGAGSNGFSMKYDQSAYGRGTESCRELCKIKV